MIKRIVAILLLLALVLSGALAFMTRANAETFIPSPDASILFIQPTEELEAYLAVVDRLYLALLRDEEDYFLEGVSYPFTVLLTEMPNEYWKAHYDDEALGFLILRENIRNVTDIYVFCEHEWDEPHKCHCEIVEAMSHLYVIYDYDFTCLQDYLVPAEWQRGE